MSYYTLDKFDVCDNICRANGKKGRTSKRQNGPKGSVSIFLPFIEWSVPFYRTGVSRDADRNGEVQYDFTSCFARQTGRAVFPGL